MKFERLRLLGFKSFCEPTDFLIEPGLTGVVGPNGCGKSNLVEALRWVMGENSYKNMRASGMDDVIFSGGGSRPARNLAEVGLVLDNSVAHRAGGLQRRRRDRGHPPNRARAGLDLPHQRPRGARPRRAACSSPTPRPARARRRSCARARSARSSRPSRRRAAAFSKTPPASPGLHSRRHEAELRLNAASENLTRLEDVLKQVDSQADSLKPQARQATRYRDLAAQIRKNEALAALLAYQLAARAAAAAPPRSSTPTGAAVQERTLEQAEAAKFQAVAAHELPPLREKEAEAGAALHRLVVARQALEADEQRAKQRIAELARQIEQFGRDLERERALIEDAAEVAQRLEDERAELQGGDAHRTPAARPRRANGWPTSRRRWRRPRPSSSSAQEQLAGVNAQRAALEAALRDETQRVARFEAELTRIETEFALIAGQGGGADEVERLAEAFEHGGARTRAPPTKPRRWPKSRHAAGARRRGRRAHAARAGGAEARQRLETEVRTLENLLANRLRRPLGAGRREHDRREGL